MTALSFDYGMSDGAGQPPVVIVPEQTNITSGTAVQEKLITAARVFSDLLKPTFGPKGLDKMLYKSNGTTAVTNDGAKIVAELLVKHPAAKMMVSMANSQEENCGDGVTTTMLLCGSLLQEGNNLLKKGLHPLTLVDGYRKSLETATDQINSDSTKIDDKKLLLVAETALTGKGTEGALDLFSSIIVKSLMSISEKQPIPRAENIAMFKSNAGNIHDSRIIQGVAFRRRVLMDSLPNKLSDVKVAIISGDIKIRKMIRTAEIQITSADQLEAFVDAEQDRKNSISQSLVDSGASLVLCGGEIDRDILHNLADNNILAVGELDSSEIENSASATGAKIVDSIADIETKDLGFCGSVLWERKEASDMVEDIIRIDGCKKPGLVTIEVGGAGEIATEEIIRGLHDGLRAVSLAIEDQEILPGGGAIHSRIANAVRVSSESEPGRARLAMEAFSRAMETIPGALVENSGNDVLDSILELRTATRNQEHFMGINEDGKISVIDSAWHPRTVITESLQLACETTIGMLRIDQVISSRGD
jgi:chaperonin GroEL (HSP60 family)